MMSAFDVEHFICEVKRRPVLWDSSDSDFSHRQAKLSAWEEVAANMYIDSESWSNYDKFGKVRDMQKRWKNIKDSYIKELRYEKKVENGMILAKKRKYLYSHLLSFISASKDKVKIDSNSNDGSAKEDSKELEEDAVNNNASNQSCNSSQDVNTSVSHEEPTENINFDNYNGRQNHIPQVALNKIPEPSVLGFQSFNESLQGFPLTPHPTSLEEDDDKMFLLSLLPYFKKLSEDQKLQARIDVTRVVHNMLYKTSKC